MLSSEGPASPEGRTLAGTYLIEGVVGEGGMGAVYRVRHLRTGGALAIKLLHREALANADIYRRFQEEARITSGLRHPNIVQVTDFDQDQDGTPFLVMELLEGENLYQRLGRLGTLPLDEVLEMAQKVGSALQAAHERGVVHRDMKPQNIFFARHEVAGEIIEAPMIVDFGLSKIRSSASHQTREQVIAGTPFYMAPEVARGKSAELDGRADQFSLAVVIYRALAGRLPFDDDDVMAVLDKVLNQAATPLSALVPSLPVHIDAAIGRAMAKNREERFPSMVDFVRALTLQPNLSGPRPRVRSNPGLPPTLRIPAIAGAGEQSTSGGNRTLTSATGQLDRLPSRLMVRRTLPSGLLAMAVGALIVAVLWRSAARQPERPAPAPPTVAAATFPVAPPIPVAPPLPTPAPNPALAEAPLPERPASLRKQKKERRIAGKRKRARDRRLREPDWTSGR